jgi:hypothetical protein
MLLAACVTGPQEPPATPTAIPTSTATVAPTPTLRPADGFVSGENAIPDGEYLFVEYFTVNDGVATDGIGLCPYAAMIDFLGYGHSDGRLTIYGGMADDGSLIGFAGYGSANQGAMGGGVSSQLAPIQELPFAFPHGSAIVHSAYSDGTIVTEIAGSAFLLAPGEAWVERWESDPSPDCHAVSLSRFTNFGLLTREAIRGLE